MFLFPNLKFAFLLIKITLHFRLKIKPLRKEMIEISRKNHKTEYTTKCLCF
jgi:hypothetical protein